MNDPRQQMPPRQTLLLILLPMLGVFVCLRLYLHLVRVQHIYPGGYLVHHLFTGVLVVIPAAFVLAFGPRSRKTAVMARVALGIGSGLVLDEMTYLVMTRASDDDYVSRISFVGGAMFVLLGALLLWVLYRRAKKTPRE